ncbi:MAG TPA: MgtC/SapB family protein [Methylomirabilota bacterium]
MNFHIELLLRIAIATALGAVIGLERQIHRRPAGLRTHMLVALASSTFMVVSTHFVYFQHYRKDDLVTIDTSRIAASVVAGTGFLAGGAILRTGLSVQGLTTGAGLWLVSSIGLAAGGGMYPESFGATVIGLVALSVVRRFEGKDDGTVRRRVAVTTIGSANAVPSLVAALRSAGCAVSDSAYESVREEGRLTVTLDVHTPADLALDGLLSAVESQPGVAHVRIASQS